MSTNKALLLVDVQNDFCPGGALAVPDGDKVVVVLNQYIELFTSKSLPIFASRDWHPVVTKHFKNYGGLWPIHCVQNTKGAEFHSKLKLPAKTIILSKGMDPQRDSYSAFQGVDKDGNDFAKILKDIKIDEIYIGGLATDYCVKSSVIDAAQNGLPVFILTDAIKGVDLKADDSKNALNEMVKSGAKKITLSEAKKQID